jgi:Protein of unknown function (DUF3987)/Zinc-binding domain of primase-helicase
MAVNDTGGAMSWDSKITVDGPPAPQDELKQRARGRWPEIITALGGVAPELLDGKGNPCPKCGGDDRFSAFKDFDETGGVICRKCHSEKNGDGLATLQWLSGWGFTEAIDKVAEYLGADQKPYTVAQGAAKDRPKGRPRKKTGRIFSTGDEAIECLERNPKLGPRSNCWTYHDKKGEPVMVAVRWDKADGKEFRPVARCGDRWHVGAMEDPRPLYRLPEVLESERPVYICEGEKATDAAVSIGLNATTSSGGSNAPHKTNWSTLAGREVVVLPDNDDSGRKYAFDVAKTLTSLDHPATVKIVELPDLPKAGDIVEWIETQDTTNPEELRSRIEELVDAADQWQPVSKTTRKTGIEFEPFPVDILPDPIGNYILEAAEAIGCNPAFIATAILTVFAACVGNSRKIELKKSWREPCVVWSALVGDASTLKSPALDSAAISVQEIEEANIQAWTKDLQEYERDKTEYDADLADWKRGGRKKGEPQPEEPLKPTAERIIITDATIEALCSRLAENPRGLLLLMDELAGWIGSFDAYRSGGGKDRPHWLSMHGARPVKVDRKTGNTLLYIPHAAVSVTGGIQPQTLQRIMTSEFFESGFMSRVLFAMPPNPVRQWTDADIAPDRQAELKSIMQRLLDLADPDPDTGEIICKNIPLSPEAKTVWISFFNQHATEQRQIMDESLTASWGKLEGYAARFALLDHLIRSAIEGPSSSFDHDQIGPESIEVGIKLSRWYGREAERVHDLFGKTETVENREDRGLVRIIQNKGGRITVRELMRSSRKYRESTLVAEFALNRLVKRQIARVEAKETGGQPKTVFVLITAGDGDTSPLNPEKNDLVSPSPPKEVVKTDKWGSIQ